jgi:16S rRNA C967 or C1407 C5-methylase (RsmB/RsmF family)/NOL1/NOP2/fmu family ribosome biogenesis protein
MVLPKILLDSLEGLSGFDRKSFLSAHEGPAPVSIRLNPAKITDTGSLEFRSTQLEVMDILDGMKPVPWCRNGYYLPRRPSFTFDPLFHAGAYYVQEASSMFPEQVFRQLFSSGTPLRVLDLCAAPGGKSTLIQSLLSADSFLVSNETIRSRANILAANMVRWGGANVAVTNNDPAHFAALGPFFDVILVDAPCSGSGLFRKEPEAMGEWSPSAVQLCSQRQQRILADVMPSLKEGGLLVYSTCSYSDAEDESIADWITDTFSVQGVSLQLEPSWNVSEVVSSRHQCPGYRFWPHRLDGEGFFLACFRKGEEGEASSRNGARHKLESVSKKEIEICSAWLVPQALQQLFRHQDQLIYFPEQQAAFLMALQKARLHILQCGVCIGKTAGTELIPDHALAMSVGLLHENVVVPLNLEQALQYLRKDLLDLPGGNFSRGWMPAVYKGFRLGWLKMLGNRWNNYYPKEWRILKSPEN